MEFLRKAEANSKNRAPGIFEAGALAIVGGVIHHNADWLRHFRDSENYGGDGYKWETVVEFREHLRSNLEKNIPKLDKVILDLIGKYRNAPYKTSYVECYTSSEKIADAIEAYVTVLLSMTLELIQKDQENGCKVFERTYKFLKEYGKRLKSSCDPLKKEVDIKKSVNLNNIRKCFLDCARIKDATKFNEEFFKKFKEEIPQKF